MTPSATANTNTAYKVVHQQMNVSGSGYTVVETENGTGTTDTNVTPGVKTYTGFTSPSTQTVKISGNGNTTVTYSYTRNKYRFTLGSATGVTTTGSTTTGDYYYGATITLKATCSGYAFKQWTSSNTGLVAHKWNANETFSMPAGAVTMTPSATECKYSYVLEKNSDSSNPASVSENSMTFEGASRPSLRVSSYGYSGQISDLYCHVPTSGTIYLKYEGAHYSGQRNYWIYG